MTYIYTVFSFIGNHAVTHQKKLNFLETEKFCWNFSKCPLIKTRTPSEFWKNS